MRFVVVTDKRIHLFNHRVLPENNEKYSYHAVKGKFFVNISSRVAKIFKIQKTQKPPFGIKLGLCKEGTEEISVSVSYHDNMD